MGLGSDQLTASPKSLYGFTGDAVILKGCIRLLLMVGESDRQATIMVDFLVIDSPSGYNVVIGRPAINNLDQVPDSKWDRVRKRRAVFSETLL